MTAAPGNSRARAPVSEQRSAQTRTSALEKDQCKKKKEKERPGTSEPSAGSEQAPPEQKTPPAASEQTPPEQSAPPTPSGPSTTPETGPGDTPPQ